MREKTLKVIKEWKPKVSSKKEKIEAIFKLIDVIETKVATLQYGYIADDEFKELRKLVERI